MTTPAPAPVRDGRFVDLAGTHNIRRVEGWRTAGGATLRPGLLLRSSGLEELTPTDSETLTAHGIARVFDLRSDGERAASPSRWHAALPPPTWSGAHCAAAANLATLIHGPAMTREELREELTSVYRAFPQDLAGALAGVFDALEQDEGPVLVHCAAGKDRTGFVVAMVLRALGVREEDVRADYLLTNETFADACRRFQERDYIAGLEARTPGAFGVLLGAHEPYLDAADAVIRENWGSPAAYLREMTGLDDARLALLQTRALDPR